MCCVCISFRSLVRVMSIFIAYTCLCVTTNSSCSYRQPCCCPDDVCFTSYNFEEALMTIQCVRWRLSKVVYPRLTA
ncbi:unnamed protein product, partial [Candidula unifasciata]